MFVQAVVLLLLSTVLYWLQCEAQLLSRELHIASVVVVIGGLILFQLQKYLWARHIGILCCSLHTVTVISEGCVFSYKTYDNQSARISGRVVSVSKTDSTMRFIVKGVVDLKYLPPVNTTCILRCTRSGRNQNRMFDECWEGADIVCYGTVHVPDVASTETNFNEQHYARSVGATFVGSVWPEKLWITERASFYQLCISAAREWIIQRFEHLFPKDVAGVLSGLVVGYTQSISEADQSIYRITGTAHMFSVSGAHVGLIFLVLFALFGGCKTHPLTRVGIAIVVMLYVVISGSSSPAIRAAVMGILFLWSRQKQIQYSAMNCLGAAIVLQLLLMPELLLQVGFIMSVCSMAGLLLITPLWMALFKRSTIYPRMGYAYIQSAIASSVGASTGITIPIALSFSTVSLLGLFANLIVVPVLSIVLVLALAVLIIPLDSLIWCITGAVRATNQCCTWIAVMSPTSYTTEQLWGVITFSLILWLWPLSCKRAKHVVLRITLVLFVGSMWWFGTDNDELTLTYRNVRATQYLVARIAHHTITLQLLPNGAIHCVRSYHE